MAIVFFISHSHKDEKIASALVTFLTMGVGVDVKEIRCTSVLSTGLAVGTDISEKLRKDIKGCDYVMPLVTKNSSTSEFVGFEIGAAWALGKPIIPVVYAKPGIIKMRPLVTNLLYRNLSQKKDLVALADELAREIFVAVDRPTASDMLNAASVFLQTVGGKSTRANSSAKG